MKFGDSIYYCKKKKGKVAKYEAPVEIVLKRDYFSLMTSKGLMDILTFGKDIDNTYIALAPIRIWGRDTFKEGDKFYVDYAKPNDDETENGEKANATIQSVRYQNLFVRLVIRKTPIESDEF